MKRVYPRARISDLAYAGVGIYRSGTHLGLLHREDGNSAPLFLHFCDHRILKNEPAPRDVTVWIAPDLDPIQLPHLAGWCRIINDLHGKTGKMPYGFSSPEAFFDANGQIRGDRVGLTCATIVLAVFHQVGVKLIDYLDWPKLDAQDRAERNRMTEIIRRKDSVQATKLASDATESRYTPLQVAGASAADADHWPVKHQTATYLGDKIKRLL